METQGNPDENNLWAVTYCSEMIVEQKYHNILPFSLGHCLSEKSIFFLSFHSPNYILSIEKCLS